MTYTPTMEQVRQAGVATYTYEQFDRWLNQVKAEAWDKGYRSGHSRAMRKMSDEPYVEVAVNPYRERVDNG